jgi:DNA polymerase-1
VLTGEFNYHGHRYSVNAYDYGDSISVYLIPYLSEDRRFLDKGLRITNSDGELDEVIPASWDRLYVSVGIGFMKVQSRLESANGSKFRSELNTEALVTFGSILRGMKSACTRKTRVDDTFGGIIGGFSPQDISTYNVPGGQVKSRMHILLDLQYSNGCKHEEGYVSLSLKEDYSYQEKIDPVTGTVKLKLMLTPWVAEKEDDGWDFGNNDVIFKLSEVIERNPDKSYVWLLDRKYEIVKSIDRVEEICQMIWRHDGLVAFDTETTGLNVNITSRSGVGDRLVGMVFSVKPGEAFYFPIAHKKVKNLCSPADEFSFIEKYFKPILEAKELLCHNGSFDWKVMYNYGIFCNIKHDTLILFKVTLWNDHRNLVLKLKSLTHDFLGRDSFELSDFVSGRFGDNVKFWDLEEESVKYYACPDTDNLIELFQYCMSQDLLGKYGAKKLYEIEVAFSLCIAYQEYYGHCVAINRIDDLVKSIQHTKISEYAAMVAMAGQDFNPRSNKELSKIVFDKLGYPILERTDTGNPKLDKDVRKAMMKENNPDGSPKYPFIRHLHEYLGVAQLESNFTKNLGTFTTEEGYTFSSVQQFLETGRVSVNNPNYQSYNDTVKKFIIPREGFYMMDADYSSVEARIMVSMAGCKAMVERLKDPDTDYHTQKASDMFGVPYELVTPQLRKMSKGVNFGILYGLGDPNLGVNLYGSKSPENTRKAKHQKELYFKGMEELKKFIEDSKAQGTSQFYSTTYFGRRRYFDPRKERRDRIERQSCNARIQGTAADIYKIAMVRLLHVIRQNGWLGKVLISAFVHDECVLEISKSIDPMVMLKTLRKCLMLEIKGWCPLFIGCGFGTNWYEAKKIEIPVQVQESLSNEFGDTGVEWWSGDGAGLRDFIIKTINEYGKGRVIEYLKNPENRGKVLSPAINSLAHNVVDAIIDGAVIDGCVFTDLKKSGDMLENLQEFCKAFGCMDLYSSANIQPAVHHEVRTSVTSEDDDEEYGSGCGPSAQDVFDMVKSRLKVTGVVYEQASVDKRLYIEYLEDDKFMGMVAKAMERFPGDSPVFAVKDGELYSLDVKVSPAVYTDLLRLYIQYYRIHNRR